MSVTHIKTEKEFQALLKDSEQNIDKLVVIDFTASWCGPCRSIAPIFEKMAKENRDVTFVKMDVDQAREASAACGIAVMPTFQFYKGGTLVEELRGANPKKLATFVQELRIAGVTKTRESELAGFCDACLSGDVAQMQQFLKVYPDFFNQPTPIEWHMHHILRHGWQPVDKTLNPGVMNASQTSFLRASHPSYGLHLAAGNGHVDMVQALLEAKANIEATDGDGDTALAWATWSARHNVIDQLLTAGADANFATNLTRQQFEAVQGDGASLHYLKSKCTKK